MNIFSKPEPEIEEPVLEDEVVEPEPEQQRFDIVTWWDINWRAKVLFNGEPINVPYSFYSDDSQQSNPTGRRTTVCFQFGDEATREQLINNLETWLAKKSEAARETARLRAEGIEMTKTVYL